MNILLRNSILLAGLVAFQGGCLALAECASQQVGETTLSNCDKHIQIMPQMFDKAPSSIKGDALGDGKSKGQPPKAGEEVVVGNTGGNAPKFEAQKR